LDNLDFEKLGGLVPAVVQDFGSGEVLMVGFMNEQAWAATQETRFVTFYSRSRQKLWTKGETSGNRLAVRQILIDCDEDTILIKVDRLGDGHVCHTGHRSCFFTEILPVNPSVSSASSAALVDPAPSASSAARETSAEAR
jgi:phosphoribosyl-AMP cyclohydrolase